MEPIIFGLKFAVIATCFTAGFCTMAFLALVLFEVAQESWSSKTKWRLLFASSLLAALFLTWWIMRFTTL